MNRLRSACVKTNSSKTCFISLSGDLAEAIGLRIQGQPFALQLQWTDGKAFTSWSGEVIRSVKHDPLIGSSSIVQLGKKFADSLGLGENQQVLVEPVLSIPSCNRISVDPVSANDWEILELHAGYIENQLLNQVRVVFPGQVLPIWIQNNMCVVVKIVDLEPNANCVRLDEFTEVIVSPKTRDLSSSKDLQQTPVVSSKSMAQGSKQILPIPDSRQQPSLSSMPLDDNSQHSAEASSTADLNEPAEGFGSDLMSRFSGYLQSLFYGCDELSSASEDKNNESLPEQESMSSKENSGTSSLGDTSKFDGNVVKDSDVQLCLRIQPEFKMDDIESNKTGLSKSLPTSMNYYSLQPSAVFVDFASLPPLVLKSWTCDLESFPPPDGTVVKTVQISKLLSPKEKAALRANNTGTNNRENTESVTQNPTPSSDTETLNNSSQETTAESSVDKPPPYWTVTMVMTSRERSSVAKPVLPGHIGISRDLQHLIGVKDLSLVKLQNVSYGPSDIKGIILNPCEDTEDKLQNISDDTALEAFQDWICSTCSAEAPLVLCSGMLLTFVVSQEGHPLQFIVTVLSHQQSSSSRDKFPYFHLTPDTLKKVTVVMGMPSNLLRSPDHVVTTQDSGTQCLKHRIADLGGVTDIFHKCLDHTLSALKQRPLANLLGGDIITGLRSGALLICGSGSGAGIGCGKTALAHAVCHQLQQWPVCAHVTVVDCIPFRGKRVDAIQKHWQQVFVEAAWHQPSVILFDDLDQIVSAPSALQEMGGEALYKRRLAQVFKELVATEIDNNSRVVVIATTKSHDSLHPSLLTSRGCHMFQCCAELHPPDANQRQEILSAMMNKRFSQEDPYGLGLSYLVKKTEGFSPKDLGSLVDRAIHKAAIRKMKTQTGVCPAITSEDFKVALDGFTPAALRALTLHTAGELGWSDVGGLAAVKGALMETLLWPTKYSWLFSKCPLRMRSGLLLYGPPGTGKTLLAGVVAKECGLNFISIKGPELLSKYIGASEQAVRDMFTRAQSAKPCILFFDEFDSLAPRRGHDSTGVTDRVVNQLLTQLDGVEGLDGVYVLAATSRPDLIDPALLRPGRLDKSLYCGIPEKSERLEILQALSRSLVLAEDANLAVISDICKNFTGADFKALLYNAQLAAIHRSSSNSQLYKGLFDKKDTEKQDGKSLETEQSGKDVFFIPSLVKGVISLPTEEMNKLHSEVMALQDCLQQSRNNGKITASEIPKHQPAGGIEITQSDLLQAASSMGPSVSDNEQRKYQAIYDTFIKSRGGEFAQNTPGQGKATLA